MIFSQVSSCVISLVWRCRMDFSVIDFELGKGGDIVYVFY